MEGTPFWTTVVLRVEEPEALEEALAWLRRGEVVAFPTDTVYGLGVRMDLEAAVERLYQVKGRPAELALPLLLAEAADMEAVCREVPDEAWHLAERFWPGPLTLVLWKRPGVPDRVTGGRPTVAVRLPDHPLPRELARRLGRPLASSSANRSGEPAPATAAGVRAQLEGCLPLILDGGKCPQARPSTLLDLTVEPPRILRAGPVSAAEIASVLQRKVLGGEDV
ncbi:MAG: L-threonylcarbamoyladenylate synthase [Chloroflexia bacterium]